jgi:hypothetical protein
LVVWSDVLIPLGVQPRILVSPWDSSW